MLLSSCCFPNIQPENLHTHLIFIQFSPTSLACLICARFKFQKSLQLPMVRRAGEAHERQEEAAGGPAAAAAHCWRDGGRDQERQLSQHVGRVQRVVMPDQLKLCVLKIYFSQVCRFICMNDEHNKGHKGSG